MLSFIGNSFKELYYSFTDQSPIDRLKRMSEQERHDMALMLIATSSLDPEKQKEDIQKKQQLVTLLEHKLIDPSRDTNYLLRSATYHYDRYSTRLFLEDSRVKPCDDDGTLFDLMRRFKDWKEIEELTCKKCLEDIPNRQRNNEKLKEFRQKYPFL